MINNKRAVSAEIFTSGVCNIECNYCYIPKVGEMKNIHSDIIDKIKSGTYIEHLKNSYGSNLEFLSFWGTEPTLTLKYLQDILPQILSSFPKLSEISWSSNFISTSKITVDFIKHLVNILPENRNFSIKFQASLDGPEAITDNNRAVGATEKITKNILQLINFINDIDLKNVTIIFNSKPTWGQDNIEYYSSNKKFLYDYYDFFENLIGKMHEANKNKNLKIQFGSGFTIAVPGRYTTHHGKLFTKVLEMLYEIEDELNINKNYKYVSQRINTYEHRLQRVLDFDRDLSSKVSMFTCSGGDSNYSLDNIGDLHICHRSLYLNNDKYVDEVINKLNVTPWDISSFDKPSTDVIKNKWIVNSYDDLNVSRFNYITSSYHNNIKLKLLYSHGMIMELAECGQINKELSTNEELRLLFSLFLNVALSCPLENIITTGIVHYNSTSLFKIFGNGAFELTYKKLMNRYSQIGGR